MFVKNLTKEKKSGIILIETGGYIMIKLENTNTKDKVILNYLMAKKQ